MAKTIFGPETIRAIKLARANGRTWKECGAIAGVSRRHAARLGMDAKWSNRRATGVHGNKGKHWKWGV